jgi:hypothetical protein
VTDAFLNDASSGEERVGLHRSPLLARRASQAVVLAQVARSAVGSKRPRQPAPDHRAVRAQLESGIERLPPGVLEDYEIVYLPASAPPWTDSGVAARAGVQITLLSAGRAYLSRVADLWVGPHVEIWARVGGRGPLQRGTRATNTFTAAQDGDVQLANGLPGEWADRDGAQAAGPWWIPKLTGGHTVGVLCWRPGADTPQALRAAASRAPEDLFAAETERLDRPPVPPPANWQHLWKVGPAEIFSEDTHAISCHTQADAAIIQHDAPTELTNQTELRWWWKIDRLPSTLAENTLATHDYMSIAVEFDNGLDLTYHWSARLPPGTVYPCPLPHWSERETHAVLRSGTDQLGHWVPERRHLATDYHTAIGGPLPDTILRVWLIANTTLQRHQGDCQYAGIELHSPGRTTTIGPPPPATDIDHQATAPTP